MSHEISFGGHGQDTFANVIAASPRTVGAFSLPRGATTDIIMGYEFPYEEERGRNLGMPSTALTFDVHLTIQGDESCLTPSPNASTRSPGPTPTKQPSPNTGSSGTATPSQSLRTPLKPQAISIGLQ